jgi:hypothetical protein
MRSSGAALTVIALLTTCGTVNSRCPAPTPIDAETQERAADEIVQLPDDSAIVTVLEAAALDREKLRFCRRLEG